MNLIILKLINWISLDYDYNELIWTILFKCLEMTIVVIWRYINKTELNWIELIIFSAADYREKLFLLVPLAEKKGSHVHYYEPHFKKNVTKNFNLWFVHLFESFILHMMVQIACVWLFVSFVSVWPCDGLAACPGLPRLSPDKCWDRLQPPRDPNDWLSGYRKWMVQMTQF